MTESMDLSINNQLMHKMNGLKSKGISKVDLSINSIHGGSLSKKTIN